MYLHGCVLSYWVELNLSIVDPQNCGCCSTPCACFPLCFIYSCHWVHAHGRNCIEQQSKKLLGAVRSRLGIVGADGCAKLSLLELALPATSAV